MATESTRLLAGSGDNSMAYLSESSANWDIARVIIL